MENKNRQARSTSLPLPSKRVIRIASKCNLNCLFCNIPSEEAMDYMPLSIPLNYIKGVIDRFCQDAAGARKVDITLSGGEPTTRKDLVEIVAHAASKKEVLSVDVQTNAVLLSNKKLVQELKKAGLSRAFVAFQSHLPDIHDSLVGRNGAYKQCLKGIRNLLNEGIDVVVNPVLNTRSYKYFPGYVKFIGEKFPEIRFISLSVIQPYGRVKFYRNLVPQYGAMDEYMRRALAEADRFGIIIYNSSCGMPFCFGGWQNRLEYCEEFAENFLDYYGHSGVVDPKASYKFSDEKTKAKECIKCDIGLFCNGLWKEYLKIYPSAKVRPVKLSVDQKKYLFEDLAEKIKEKTEQSDVNLPKHWTRLTKNCNNSCLFCLDADSRENILLSLGEIKNDLQEGIKTGAQRVVLSGGEPTLHPDFIEIVKMASKMGYLHIQTVTNGFRFADADFLKKAVKAGLKEITFSVHGHNSELHDHLVGRKGAFVGILRALKNTKTFPDLVVSIDVCVNGANYRYLPEMVKIFTRAGFYEYDILWVTPFGSAWKNKNSMLFKDPVKAVPYLAAAFEFSKDPKVHIWTNRLPAQYLEGYEKLIQDPLKIHEEIEGKKQMARDIFLRRQKPGCFPDRCGHCFIRDLCRDMLDLKNNGFIASRKNPPACLASSIKKQLPRKLLLTDIVDGSSVDLKKLVDFYISERYFVKSLRCKNCKKNKSCEGANIFLIRKNGFKILKPCK